MVKDYLAGMFDVRGMIFTAKYKDHYYPICRLYSRRPEILDLFVSEFGGRVVRNRVFEEKGVYTWEARRRADTASVLRSLSPLLILKKPQCDLALRLLKTTGEVADALANEIKSLNSSNKQERER